MNELRCSPCNKINKEYPIFIGTDIIKERLHKLVSSYNPDKVVIITDSTVGELYGAFIQNIISDIPSIIVSMPAGEKNKTPEVYLNLCNKVLEQKITKKTFCLILGGGVPGNVGGFVVSTIMRGLRFAHIPTTVIAQADSTTGGKQGVNTIHGKNLLGLFNDPEFVLIDTLFLKTLPAREIRGGIAECIKHALCQDPQFVTYLLEELNEAGNYTYEVLREIIFRTLQLKLHILRYDAKEINEGKALVYGHTVGHALETLANYQMTHGEAISIGMMFVAYAALELHITTEEMVAAHRNLFLRAGLPISFPDFITEDALVEQLCYDKKYASNMELILIEKIGKLQSKDGRIGYSVDENFIRMVYQKYF